jgi:hypothetical protein
MMLLGVPHLLSRTVLHINFLSLAVIYLTTSMNILKSYMARRTNLCILVSRTTLTDWFCITVAESVYCAVRTESLYKTDTFRL